LRKTHTFILQLPNAVEMFFSLTVEMGPTDLGNTEEYIVNSMKSKANVCLVCIETIKRVDPVSNNFNNNNKVPILIL